MNTLYKLNALIPLFLAGLQVLLPDESIAQVYPRQSDIRPNTIDEIRNRQSLQQNRPLPSSNYTGIGKSDLGIQRPIDAKKTGFGYHLGFDTKLYFSNNPASIDSGSLKEPSGVWENSLRNNFLLGVYDLGGLNFSPIINLSYTKFTHFGDDLFENFDFDTVGLNFAGIFQFGKGWSIRPSLGLNFDLNPKEGLKKQYHQISPALFVAKGFKIRSVQAFVEWSLAQHYTDSAYLAPGFPDDKLNRFETALTTGLKIPFNNFEFSPFLHLAFNNYSNQDRKDFLTNLGLDLKYSFSTWFYLKVFANLSMRQSDDDIMDFNRFDTGLGAALNAKF